MNVLVVGGGGREHALAWKLVHDSSKPAVFCAPGNAGTAAIATNLDIAAEDLDGLVAWAEREQPGLTVIGPEAPLCAGLTDRLEALGLRVFGPGRAAAEIEGSKVFSKKLMAEGNVPTAVSATFTDTAAALAYVRAQGAPIVVKADGLAAGKGVMVCPTLAEAEEAVRHTMEDKAFGDAGSRVVIEECLVGEEVSILALVDGEHVVMLASAQDHKRVFNHDEGPNTGGMGAYSPAPVMTEDLWPPIREMCFDRLLGAMRARGITYKGVLYAGLMMTADGPKVLEYNCRFGDPETQAILPRIKGDLLPALLACTDGTLTPDLVRWRDEACVCVVLASGGYPGPYEKGKPIDGLAEAEAMADVVVIHAGTALAGDQVVTAGGRVLGVTALGADLQAAVKRVYLAITRISFDQAQYRTDIAARGIQREKDNG